MLLDPKHFDQLTQAHRDLSDAAARLGELLTRGADFPIEEFDEVCDGVNAAAARLRYVRVFIERIEFADPDDTLS